MAQYMRDAITAQGAGQNEAFSMFGKAMNRMAQVRGHKFGFPGGKSGQRAPLGTPMGVQQFAGLMSPNAPQQASTTTSVASPGQTQVIRPSAQAARRQGPSAETDTSLLTRQMGPEDVALGMSSLLGG